MTSCDKPAKNRTKAVNEIISIVNCAMSTDLVRRRSIQDENQIARIAIQLQEVEKRSLNPQAPETYSDRDKRVHVHKHALCVIYCQCQLRKTKDGYSDIFSSMPF